MPSAQRCGMPGEHPLRGRLVRVSAVAVLASTLLASTPGSSAVRAVPQPREVSPTQLDHRQENADRVRRP